MFENALPEKARDVLEKIAPVIRNEKFYLAGGTGLALQIGHRLSEDMDFFKGAYFNERVLLSELRSIVDSCEEILVEKQTVWTLLNGVRCSFFFYEVPLVFTPIEFEGMEIARWEDILAEKFKTISQRGSKKDFYDVFLVTGAKSLTIEEAVGYLRKRFESTGLNTYHILRSLTYFEDADGEPDPVLAEGYQYSWEEVKSFFLQNIKEFERVLAR